MSAFKYIYLNPRNTRHNKKSLKARDNPKNLKRIFTSSTLREITTQGITKCNNK